MVGTLPVAPVQLPFLKSNIYSLYQLRLTVEGTNKRKLVIVDVSNSGNNKGDITISNNVFIKSLLYECSYTYGSGKFAVIILDPYIDITISVSCNSNSNYGGTDIICMDIV